MESRLTALRFDMTVNRSLDAAFQFAQVQLAKAVRAAARPGRPAVLVDMPPYLNLGDSLIAIGEMSLLREGSVDLRGIYHGHPPSRVLQQIDEQEGTIFIHGGGNFGTLWPAHQEFRERIATDYRRTRIVQLPQSIHFATEDSAARSFGVLRSHPDFVLFVRDEPSRALAIRHGIDSPQLNIDSAFMLDVGHALQPIASYCLLARGDLERRYDTDALAAGLRRRGATVVCDWGVSHTTLPACVSRWRIGIDEAYAGLLSRRAGGGSFPGGMFGAARFYGNRLAIAKRALCAGTVLVTDRLHAHILAVLLKWPHVYLDNSYSKIDRFASAWGTSSPIARRAGSEAEAIATAGEMHESLTRAPARRPTG
jgi:pyruvyl transferase EpsO